MRFSLASPCGVAAAALSLLFCGCGKKPTAASPDQPTSAPPATAEAAPAAPPVQNRPAPANPTVISATANAEAALGELSQAVRRYSAERQRVPATLAEVVSAGYIRNLPQPPPGKRYVIDAKRLTVVLQ